MNKFVASLVLALCSCASVAQEQVAALETGARLPEFVTTYKFSTGNYVNDISLTEVSGLTGRLKVEGTKCFIDAKVSAKDNGENFEIIVSGMTPRNTADAAFCGGITQTLVIPKKPGMFGTRTGVMNSQTARATFSFSG